MWKSQRNAGRLADSLAILGASSRCRATKRWVTMRRGPMQLQLLPYSPERDVYRLLQVDPRAGSDEVIAACRRLARTFHPDHNGSQHAHEEMQVVNAVRGLLTDPGARAEYDVERLRFWSSQSHRGYRLARTPRPMRPAPAAPARPLPAAPSALARNVRAAMAGLQAALAALAPVRCDRCRSVIDRRDDYCTLCGHRLLTSAAR